MWILYRYNLSFSIYLLLCKSWSQINPFLSLLVTWSFFWMSKGFSPLKSSNFVELDPANDFSRPSFPGTHCALSICRFVFFYFEKVFLNYILKPFGSLLLGHKCVCCCLPQLSLILKFTNLISFIFISPIQHFSFCAFWRL